MLLFHIAIAFELTSCCSWKLKSPFSRGKICCCFFPPASNALLTPKWTQLCEKHFRYAKSCGENSLLVRTELGKVRVQPTCSKFERNQLVQSSFVQSAPCLIKCSRWLTPTGSIKRPNIKSMLLSAIANLSSTRTKTWAYPAGSTKCLLSLKDAIVPTFTFSQALLSHKSHYSGFAKSFSAVFLEHKHCSTAI